MGSFASKQWPCASLAPAVVRTAILLLTVAVVVVAAPAVAIRGLDLQNVIDDFERIDDERIVGAPDAVADEFEEAGIDDLAGLEVALLAGLAVVDVNPSVGQLGVVERLAHGRRVDAHVVVLDCREQDAFVGRRPLVEMRFDPVCVGFEEAAEFSGLTRSRDIGGTDQGGDDGGECRGGVACGLLPALLLRDRGVADEEGGCTLDEGKDVEAHQGH